MTTPKQTIFNPGKFQAPVAASDEDGGADASTGQLEKKEYKVTGNATRDQVRKLLFESFAGDKELNEQQSKLSMAEVVDQIENDIFGKRDTQALNMYRGVQGPEVEAVS